MATNKYQELEQELLTTQNLLQSNRAEQAVSKLERLLVRWPQNPDVAHLMALSLKAIGDQKSATEYFLRSLSLNSQQPQVHNNLANLYKAMAQYKNAEKHYLAAMSLQPNFIEAIRNLALCYSANHDYEKALSCFDRVLLIKTDDIVALTGKADCYRELSDFIRAGQLYKEAVALAPQHLNPRYKLGQNYHLNGELAEAIDCYQKAYLIAPNEPAVIISLASSLHETGATESSLQMFQQALQAQPENVSLHERYNEIIWESEFADQFCHSYQSAIATKPLNLDLRLSYISQLFRAGRTEFASKVLIQALIAFPNNYRLLFLKGQIEADQGHFNTAQRAFEEGLRHTFDKDAAQALVKVFIILKEYSSAQNVLNLLFQSEANCQLSWALQSLVWRLSDDSRYHWLNNYEQFVKSYVLETPQGYASLAEYLQALSKVLLGLHRADNAPLQQTLRHGTQTAARLLHRHEPELTALKQQLNKIVQQYIDEMPEDSEHPLLRRKSQDFEFSGSWSVKLKPNGFHVNHVHPAGWISSSCYISIPDSMSANPEDLKGCIKFGESPMQLGELEVIAKTVHPVPGMVVLFPSYMWHGTYPFDGKESDFRLTSPFDIAPQ
jgi:tetratricopeptide (TPR) repeat protein